MLDAALSSGVAGCRSVFEVFARELPAGRRYGVVAGLGRLLDLLGEFTFGDPELAFLEADRVVSPRALEWLAGFSFSGMIDAYAEGECYFPGSPVLTVEAPFGEALLLETIVLSALNYDTAVASAAARMVEAAGDRPLVEMGSRRAHEEAAIAAARAAYLAGFVSTSNLEAGRRYGIPTAGTAAHAFTLAHRSEAEAFGAQLDVLGLDTTLLVDTYDVADAIRTGVAEARARGASGPGAIRLDSGELAEGARQSRALLDELGATSTRIVASSDLDEYALAELRSAPIDIYGVGTRLVTGSGAPTAGFVYKLVAVADGPGAEPLRPVAKQSVHKETIGGRKLAFRLLDPGGVARREILVLEDGTATADIAATLASQAGTEWSARPLQLRVVDAGRRIPGDGLGEARARACASLGELSPEARSIVPGEPALRVSLVDA
jgi:nicotinate phosphoribosyltransferase